MNIDKLFKAAADAGIELFEARIGKDSALTVEIFDGELEKYTIADDGEFKVRGTVNGKVGVFTADRSDDEVIPLALTALKESAEYGNPIDPEFFIDGGKYSYEKVDTYNAKLADIAAATFIEKAKEIARLAKSADKRVENVTVQLEYADRTKRLVNSKGLDLCSRLNYVTLFAEIKATDGNEVQSGSHYELISDFDSFDANKFVATLVASAVNLLGGGTVDTGKYNVVYSPQCTAAFVKTLCDGFSAFKAEQNMSLLKDKMGTAAFSTSLTVEQTPIGNDVFCSSFDDEGVPCKNRLLVDKGVPTGFIYDLETAKRAGVQSTGNGRLVGGNIRPSVEFVTVHNGEYTQDRLFERVGDGIYITEINGMHAGLDEQTGNYSLQACGYIIKNGKLDRPISLMTVAGNIITDFANLIAVGNDEKLTYYAVKAPSIAVSNLSVSGVKTDN